MWMAIYLPLGKPHICNTDLEWYAGFILLVVMIGWLLIHVKWTLFLIMTKTIYHLGERSVCWWAFGLMFWFPKVKQDVYGCGRNCMFFSQRTTNNHFKGDATNWALQHLVLYVQGMVHSFKTRPESQLNTCICKSLHNKQILFSKGLDPHRRSIALFVLLV